MPENPSFHRPEITRDEEGVAHIEGTRIPVWLVAVGLRNGRSLDRARKRIAHAYSLTPAQVDSAIAFYRSNKHEIEQDLKEYRRQAKLYREHSDPTTGMIDREALERALAA